MTIEEQATSISHTREHVAGAPRYDPDLVAEDAHDFFGLYPYYGYPNFASGWPWARRDPC